MKLLFFSSNGLGYGSIQYNYFIKAVSDLEFISEIIVIEPKEDRAFVEQKFNKKVTRRIKDNKLFSKIFLLNVIIKSYLSTIIVVETYPSWAYRLLSKKTIRVAYFYEIWTDHNSEKQSPVVCGVDFLIAPQEDRLKIAAKIYKNAAKYLVENCETINFKSVLKTASKNILYQGQISKEANASELFRLLKGLPKEFQINLVGPVSSNVRSEFECILDDCKNIKYHGYVAQDRLTALQRDSTIGIVTWDDTTLTTKFACPTKLYQYVAQGLLVVSLPNYSIRKLNNKYGFGYVSNDTDDAINFLTNLTKDEIIQQSAHNINIHQSILNYEAQIKKFISDFERKIKHVGF